MLSTQSTKKQTDYLQVRLDSKLKHEVTDILYQLGMTPSQAVKILFSQISMQKALPLDISIPTERIEILSDKTVKEVGQALKEIGEGEYTEIDMSDKKQVKKFFGL
ncbi:type II toxin-antitoxin system RelB/DinJ family antitoxin [Patescibacteria group bacterium]|nr:type II toxin-antitoxin system RelB/DinJ family antitoxin [Patescibacteria group bacterium]MCG2701559.1 type II toxin-antitoxin system RelB/DinJ family antitoxin [Candidatus Parcubacteria bacterium]MBU4210283.1 type II toxin-antitoxin system RelB/DinJ family antitoxin [Patescibacteria group bacterium]MBU4264473.1 type II toxin-antitoxin system RelB/DinJ family antitoxin [Patescibacteria group bacterium]MBU4390404.1 type II toxin-antitoxin system RelB/DinJ family antitoxin [Patescibacteria gr